MAMSKGKQLDKPKYVCKNCSATFNQYDDGRGGEIGKTVCKKCSCNGNQNIDRGNPREMKRYMGEVCKYYQDGKYANTIW
jgi:hypothetical protein